MSQITSHSILKTYTKQKTTSISSWIGKVIKSHGSMKTISLLWATWKGGKGRWPAKGKRGKWGADRAGLRGGWVWVKSEGKKEMIWSFLYRDFEWDLKGFWENLKGFKNLWYSKMHMVYFDAMFSKGFLKKRCLWHTNKQSNLLICWTILKVQIFSFFLARRKTQGVTWSITIL